MSSPAIIPEMRVHCDDSQAEQNIASFPASANPVQCGGPGSPATTRNCGACSELRGRLRSASNIHRLNPADKAEICCHADLSVVIGRPGRASSRLFPEENLPGRLSSPSAFADLAGDIKLGNLRLSKKDEYSEAPATARRIAISGI